MTLGCAPGVEAVTTGTDLVDVIRLEQDPLTNATDYAVADGTLRNYGAGQWVFYPRTQCLMAAVFRGSDAGGAASSAGRSGSFAALVALGSVFKWFARSWNAVLH